MYVGSDGRVTAKRSLATYFTWPEIKRLFWELINVIVLLFVLPPFTRLFCCCCSHNSSRPTPSHTDTHSFKSIFKPDAVAEAENRRRHGCGGPGFTTSGSSGGGDNGSGGGPTRRPMGRINHTCLFTMQQKRPHISNQSPILQTASMSCPTSG